MSTNGHDGQNGWRSSPLYSVPEVARLAHITSVTVRRWLYGDDNPGRYMRPVFDRDRATQFGLTVSFLELAEVVIVSEFRRKHIKLERVRRAHQFARDTFHLDYPFARLSLRTDGVHILLEFQEREPGDRLLELSEGQWALPGHVAERLEAFDFFDDLAERWYPLGHHIPIVIDPRFGAGLPTVPGRRLPILTVYKRWKTGEPIKVLCEDFDLQPEITERMLQYAENIAA